MNDPTGFFKFESAVILTEELHQSLTRHPHALHLVLCLLQMLLSHLVTDKKIFYASCLLVSIYYSP